MVDAQDRHDQARNNRNRIHITTKGLHMFTILFEIEIKLLFHLTEIGIDLIQMFEFLLIGIKGVTTILLLT